MSISIKLVQKSVHNVLLLEIGVKTLCVTVVLLEICAMCKKAKNCGIQRAQLKIGLNWLVRSVYATKDLNKKASSVKKEKKRRVQNRVHNWFVAPNHTRQTILRNCRFV